MSLLQQGLFAGEYRHNLDAKNRLTVPAKWRFEGDEQARYAAIPNPNGCITLYPPNMSEKLLERLSSVSIGDAKGQLAITQVFGRSDSVAPDKQGRINLVDPLVKHAGLKKETVMVGAFTVFHIWEPAKYARYLEGKLEPTQQELEFFEILKSVGL